MSGPVEDPMWLDFTWELDANSDHWSFIEKRFPVVMLHTGLHSDYHRPSDDVEKINHEGLRDIARYLLGAIIKAANEDRLPTYRDRGLRESNSNRRAMERPLAKISLANWPDNTPPPRLGISWREDVAETGSVLVTRVVDGTPAAAAGIAVQDRIYEIDGQPFADATAFQAAIHALLNSGAPEFSLLTERRGHERTVTVKMDRNSAPKSSD
jgi:S1-C subfamily serine protease